MGFLQLPGLGKVHFHEYGTGQRPMLAFHGYGMTGKQFTVLEKSILTKYHVYGFDHFFHGGSALDGWTEQQIVAGMPRELIKLYMEAWFNKYGRQKVSLMAYSIGANIALILLEEFADWIDDIILMAPDGLGPFKGFKFIQQHPVGKLIFAGATKSKWLAPAVLKNLKRLKFIDNDLYTIAYNEIDTPQKRLDVYYTLNLIKQLKPDMEKVVSIINQNHIKHLFIFGKQDMLFPKSAAISVLNKLKQPNVHEVQMGHWLVTAKLDEYMLNCNI